MIDKIKFSRQIEEIMEDFVNKKYDIRGSEFLDYRVEPTSKQVNIYGHNTRDNRIKVAFIKLEKFIDQDFFNKNQYIILFIKYLSKNIENKINR